jgi:uncharacterized Rmd1/YagE family protein
MSLALAQSTRLSMQEELTMRIIESTKHYPSLLVGHGHVHFHQEEVAKMIGNVFLQKTELNLQVSVCSSTVGNHAQLLQSMPLLIWHVLRF